MPQLKRKHLELEQKLKEGPPEEKLVDKMVRMGKSFDRLIELRQIAGGQFFTDVEHVAREFAGPVGFVIVIDVPHELAVEHYQNEHTMMPGEEMVMNSNFLFSGSELIDHADEWNLDAINIASEREEQNRELGEKNKEREGGSLSRSTIHGNEDLSETDEKAVQQMREQLGSLFKSR